MFGNSAIHKLNQFPSIAMLHTKEIHKFIHHRSSFVVNNSIRILVRTSKLID